MKIGSNFLLTEAITVQRMISKEPVTLRSGTTGVITGKNKDGTTIVNIRGMMLLDTGIVLEDGYDVEHIALRLTREIAKAVYIDDDDEETKGMIQSIIEDELSELLP